MTAEEFLAWALESDFRGELVGGEVVAMAPERYAHGRTKGFAFRALGDAIARAGLPCEAIIDSMAVQVDKATLYQPDVILRCGPPLDDATMIAPDPVVLVEVLSPSTAVLDTGGKLEGYFRIPSVRHYLILRAETRTVIHHARETAEGAIATRILREEGTLSLDPPGIVLDLAALFGPPPTPA
jgi:Uma2 family endonuclease